MRLAALFSGGKDSTYALFKAMQDHEVVCLITIVSENPDSYMFHTPNISLSKLQAEAIGIPLITMKTKGEKELELEDLKKAIIMAVEDFNIEGVVTGAIESVYQKERIQKICDDLKLECINPLWKIDQIKLLHELIENNFEVIIMAIAAYPLDESWLGKEINAETITEFEKLREKYKINPSGEGGEYESLVLNAPFFKKRVVIKETERTYSKYCGKLHIKKAELE